jgi:hypothetical protein
VEIQDRKNEAGSGMVAADTASPDYSSGVTGMVQAADTM